MYACNVVLYNKKCTFGSHPISGRVLNALGISCDESNKGIFDYVKEVIFGKYPRNLWSQPCV